ncbi:MAG TPA: TonB-dependent receptor [Blastocatellia bacterium]|nr:TonB-dependent receptor [Blastocatellia bacterium]
MVCLLLLAAGSSVVSQTQAAPGNSISGTVVDALGAPVEGARVSLSNAQQASFQAAVTDNQGHFEITVVETGSYVLTVRRESYGDVRIAVDVPSDAASSLHLTLPVAPITDKVTVTAEAGQVGIPAQIPQAVNIISDDQIRMRAKSVLAQAANEEVGVALQRTSPTIGGIFIRGLTGKNVNVYVDGIRYTTSTQRGGISTFFNMNDPSGLSAMEILRGPSSAQYGSDSLGGTINLVNRVPFFSATEPEVTGEIGTFYNSPDNSFGGNARVAYGTTKFGLLANVFSRRINTLRAGGILDGHAAVTRFLGLPSDILGEDRIPDSAFTQYGGAIHMNYAPTDRDQFVVRYERSQQDGGKRYDQLLGGDGNLRADLRNFMLDFLYGRYYRQGLGFFDTFTTTFSLNAQREERVNQGGNGNPLGSITSQYEKTYVYGYSFQLTKLFPHDNDFLLGADLYHEHVNAPAYSFSPSSGTVTPSRPRVPNKARYLQYGFFAQDNWDAIPTKLRFSGALRYSVASYESCSCDSPLVNGKPLWPSDSLRAGDFSGRAGVVVTPVSPLSIAFNYSRGYRAPNITDLGTLGLTGDGYEVSAPDVSGLGASVGTTADDTAVSSGQPVVQLESEWTNNYDLAVRYANDRFEFSTTGFIIDFNNTITKQSLILPQGAVGLYLGGQQIISQDPNGVVFVAASSAPVLVRANFGPANIKGFESEMLVKISRDFKFAGNFTYIRAEEEFGMA